MPIHFLKEQAAQHNHDMRTGMADGSPNRLKDYGLRLSVIAGLVGNTGQDARNLLGGAFAIVLSSANMLRLDLGKELALNPVSDGRAFFIRFADAAGDYADAGEKIDHLEDFRGIACDATRRLAAAVRDRANELGVDLAKAVHDYRECQLSSLAMAA